MNKLAPIIALAISIAAATDIPKYCAEEILALSKGNNFDVQKFTSDLPQAVAKAKLQAKAPFGKPKDSDKTEIGITFGCLKAFPESSGEITSLLKDVSQELAKDAVANQLYENVQEMPQQVQYQYPSPQYVSNAEQQAKVQQLIYAGLIKNKEEIQKASFYLSPMDRNYLYDRNKKEGAAGWAALDFFIGFGLGSYLQGDMVYGKAQSIMDATGWTLSIIGLANMYQETRAEDAEGGIPRTDTNEFFLGLAISGWVILGSSRIMSWIFPFIHQTEYNKTLNSALNGNGFSYSIDPLIVPRNGVPSVGLAFNVRY